MKNSIPPIALRPPLWSETSVIVQCPDGVSCPFSHSLEKTKKMLESLPPDMILPSGGITRRIEVEGETKGSRCVAAVGSSFSNVPVRRFMQAIEECGRSQQTFNESVSCFKRFHEPEC